ncbi:2-keto-4-pentenoate hydratase [Actinacidiphila cocklensis]|uniref:2-keto-4-pentenoate hydratase n=1 Tax=Actinacidiphila cocklensis TaxID=887465 RepID=A0A9W4DTZ7_9ACTN|nr:2-keto-4-pentenoate hydratase [Actinacidiphila cocklensis]
MAAADHVPTQLPSLAGADAVSGSAADGSAGGDAVAGAVTGAAAAADNGKTAASTNSTNSVAYLRMDTTSELVSFPVLSVCGKPVGRHASSNGNVVNASDGPKVAGRGRAAKESGADERGFISGPWAGAG